LYEPIVRYADLAPTLLQVLGLPAERFDGTSLFETRAADHGAYGETWYPPLHHGWSPLHSWRDARWAYLEGPNPELYDRAADPGERRNVIDRHPDVALSLSERIAAIARDAEEPAILLDDAELEKLAALGYVSTGSGGLEWSPDKDPKQLVGSLNTLYRGMTLAKEGRPYDALPLLQRAYGADPDNVMAVMALANCFRLIGERSTAMKYYRRTIELTPRAGEAWSHLALLEFEGGRREEAFALLEEGLSYNPDQFPLLMTTGDLRAEIGETTAAIALYERAAAAEPHRPEPWLQLAVLADARGDRTEAERLRAEARRVSSPETP
jgi:tetratricopeptide (TPR) repeat protein